MSSISIEQDLYKTYILTDESALARLEVVPERGGIVTRWQVQDKELMYLDTERFTHPELSVRGGVPILFPICGNLPDNTYSHNGQTYTLKQHGFARDLPWEVLGQSTEAGASLTVGLSSSDRTLAVYPFEFELAFTYRLQGNTLVIHQRYTNRSAEAMPFSAGFHPYFAVIDKSQLQVEIPSTQFYSQVDRAVHDFSGSFDFSVDEIDAAFGNVTQQTASVVDRSQNLKLTIDYDPLFSTLVFWTVKGKDFYCLEPWTGPRNALNTGENLIRLEPGASLELTMSMTASF
ncbi:MAG: aldose epimerase [Oscillatoriophycideae cyanobacterium NC_groundwater_1537_Pr4_S-0.65um_50_18]|nr:aldose epimerase [Oscillatoriophycideae cyanobacterium NC_groundwater_1537_Pr4_S-0.65um_50_18]